MQYPVRKELILECQRKLILVGYANGNKFNCLFRTRLVHTRGTLSSFAQRLGSPRHELMWLVLRLFPLLTHPLTEVWCTFVLGESSQNFIRFPSPDRDAKPSTNLLPSSRNVGMYFWYRHTCCGRRVASVLKWNCSAAAGAGHFTSWTFHLWIQWPLVP